ncbi:MAG: zf-HC2 domain-containing protein [Acidobacteria bacterium]|nr:zf-HC2 domain-containing protein [Acidobacteriota bacterium]
MTCGEVREAMHRYLDGELAEREVTGFESHLLDCAACRTEHSHWQEAVDAVRGAREAYRPSERSERLVRELMYQAEQQAERAEHSWQWWRAAAAVVLTAGALGGWLAGWFEGDGGSFRVYAAESHLRYARGRLNLDASSGEPAVLSSWLEDNLPFHLELPAYPQATPGDNAYELVGARLLRHEDDDVAFLSYTMRDKPVSLLVASAGGREPVAGEIYRSGELDFHFYSVEGLKLISWVDNGLSYVIVSDVDAAGGESCVVCHGNSAERRKFEGLEPAR